MARYVDFEKTDELAVAMYNLLSSCHLNYKVGCFADDCRECLRRFLSPYGSGHLLPAVDVRPVVHGHWDTGYFHDRVCSCCLHPDNDLSDYAHAYCPHCGAKMDGKE